MSTEDDGSRVVYEDCCELCGKRRRKPYSYVAKAHLRTDGAWTLYLLLLIAGLTFGIVLGLVLAGFFDLPA